MIRFLVSLFLLFYSAHFFSQATIDESRRRLFYDRYQEFILDNTKASIVGNEMIKLAQTPYESSISYLTVGRYYYDNCDYVKSVDYLQKSYDFAASVDSVDTQLDVLTNLIPAYRRAGLTLQSDENFSLLKKVAKKTTENVQKMYISFAQAKIADIDRDFCTSAKVRKDFFDHLKPIDKNVDIDLRYKFSVLNQLCYVQIKCGTIAIAKESMILLDKMYSRIDKGKPIKLIDFYYLNKALLYNLEGNKKMAKENFDVATEIALKTETKVVIKDILTERLNANLDAAEEQLKFTKIVSEIDAKMVTVTQNLTYKESMMQNLTFKRLEQKSKILISISIIAFILMIIVIVVFRYNRKKAQMRFNEIIRDLNNSKNNITQKSGNNNENVATDIIKNNDTEINILRKLESFERKNLFTTKGISSAQMAVMLKTNTKYLSHILKKYRYSDFPNYINDRRINYIIDELNNNPLLLKYKISALSEMCGYTSHSQFTMIFKLKNGVSPSQFIYFLSKENNVL